MKSEPSDDYIEHLFETAKENKTKIDMSKLRKHKRRWAFLQFFSILFAVYGFSAVFIKNVVYKNICIVILTSFIIFCYKFCFNEFRFKSKLYDGIFKNMGKPML